MLNRKKTRPDITPVPLKIAGAAYAAFLAVLLCAVFTVPSHAQEYRQYSPDVEINTSVLNEMSRQMDDGRESHNAPVQLKRPTPRRYDSYNDRQRPALTGRAIEQNPENRYDHIIMPRVIAQEQDTDALPGPEDNFRIIPETKLDATIEDPPLPPHKSEIAQGQKLAVNAPLPAKKPRTAIRKAHVANIKNIPVPPKRPAIQQASRSFVAQKRMSSAQAFADARVTDKNAPNLLASAQKTMPATPASPVITEQLAGERVKTNKNTIIDAVQQIASANKEPEIDITAASSKPRTRTQQAAQDITAANTRPQDITPAAGNAAPAKVAAYSTNRGEIVRIPFPSKESKIDNAIKAAMNAHILPSLQSDSVRRIQLQSYASQKQGRSTLNARRISLSRALSARQYLIAMGIEAKRIDIMPLGDKTDENQEDRIDFLIFNPNAS